MESERVGVQEGDERLGIKERGENSEIKFSLKVETNEKKEILELRSSRGRSFRAAIVIETRSYRNKKYKQ